MIIIEFVKWFVRGCDFGFVEYKRGKRSMGFL